MRQTRSSRKLQQDKEEGVARSESEDVWAVVDQLAQATEWASAELRRLRMVWPRGGERAELRGGERNQPLYERAGLTRCEREVLELKEQGNTTKIIAELRGVSRHTVRTQLTKARQKVRASRANGASVPRATMERERRKSG